MLHVHLHEAALISADAVARVEGLGPTSVSALCALLGRTRLTVCPVRDLSSRVRSTAYEHPESLKEQVYLTTGGDYWPFATSTSRQVDYDHPTPYDDTGPPDPKRPQTGSHNSGPLGRRHHRWKTHAAYRSRQCGQGRYVRLSPHGLAFIVDHRGTRRIDPHDARGDPRGAAGRRPLLHLNGSTLGPGWPQAEQSKVGSSSLGPGAAGPAPASTGPNR